MQTLPIRRNLSFSLLIFVSQKRKKEHVEIKMEKETVKMWNCQIHSDGRNCSYS